MKRKVRIANHKPSPLLPSLEETLGLLALPSSLSDFALNIAQEKQLPLPVDRKTLTYAKKKPVKVDTARKILRFIANHGPHCERGESPLAFFNSEFRRLARQASKEPGNSGLWRVWLYGHNKSDPEGFPRTKNFILKRCDAEAELFERSQISDQKLEVPVEVYVQETLVDQRSIEAALRDVLEKNPNKVHAISKTTAATMVRLYLDFFLWIMAWAEKDLIEFYVSETNDTDPALHETGVILPMLPRISNGEYCTPLDSLLDHWRHRIAEKLFNQSKPLSWRKFSAFLPDPTRSSRKMSDTCDLRTINNKYREMAAWRSGKVVPSEEKLRGFIGNLLPPCREQEWFFWLAQVAVAMNRLYQEIDQSRVFTEDEIVGFFQQYKDYRQVVWSRSMPVSGNRPVSYHGN
ncbi:MAG: hypothetical protein Tsb0017_08960 [Geothermobacteraceae bacterium]